MRYQEIPGTSLRPSKICLGSNNFDGQVSHSDAIRIIQKSLELGLNIIDTANVYTQGRSEKTIGDAVHGQRDDVIIATKVGMEVGDDSEGSGLSPTHIASQLAKSLSRLQTSYIDIYYMHRPDPHTPLEVSLEALSAHVDKGSIRYIGCSNFGAEEIREAERICRDRGFPRIVALQPRYNLLDRSAESTLFPLAKSKGLGVFTYSPLSGGYLTGKYAGSSTPPQGSRAAHSSRYAERIKQLDGGGLLRKLGEIASSVGISPKDLALAWVLHNDAVTAPIVGASTVEQVESNCRVTELNVPGWVFEELDRASAVPNS